LNSKNKKKRSHSSKTTALDCTLFSKKLKINRPKKRNEGKVPKKRKTQKKQNQEKDKKGLNLKEKRKTQRKTKRMIKTQKKRKIEEPINNIDAVNI